MSFSIVAEVDEGKVGPMDGGEIAVVNEAKSVLAIVLFAVNAERSAESTGSMQEGQVKERSSQSAKLDVEF